MRDKAHILYYLGERSCDRKVFAYERSEFPACSPVLGKLNGLARAVGGESPFKIQASRRPVFSACTRWTKLFPQSFLSVDNSSVRKASHQHVFARWYKRSANRRHETEASMMGIEFELNEGSFAAEDCPVGYEECCPPPTSLNSGAGRHQ